MSQQLSMLLADCGALYACIHRCKIPTPNHQAQQAQARARPRAQPRPRCSLLKQQLARPATAAARGCSPGCPLGAGCPPGAHPRAPAGRGASAAARPAAPRPGPGPACWPRPPARADRRGVKPMPTLSIPYPTLSPTQPASAVLSTSALHARSAHADSASIRQNPGRCTCNCRGRLRAGRASTASASSGASAQCVNTPGSRPLPARSGSAPGAPRDW